VTSDTPGVFGSPGNLTQNQTFTFTFTTAGTFPYHCSIHPYMKAKITVTS
jgi:plastocyanin